MVSSTKLRRVCALGAMRSAAALLVALVRRCATTGGSPKSSPALRLPSGKLLPGSASSSRFDWPPRDPPPGVVRVQAASAAPLRRPWPMPGRAERSRPCARARPCACVRPPATCSQGRLRSRNVRERRLEREPSVPANRARRGGRGRRCALASNAARVRAVRSWTWTGNPFRVSPVATRRRPGGVPAAALASSVREVYG